MEKVSIRKSRNSKLYLEGAWKNILMELITYVRIIFCILIIPTYLNVISLLSITKKNIYIFLSGTEKLIIPFKILPKGLKLFSCLMFILTAATNYSF